MKFRKIGTICVSAAKVAVPVVLIVPALSFTPSTSMRSVVPPWISKLDKDAPASAGMVQSVFETVRSTVDPVPTNPPVYVEFSMEAVFAPVVKRNVPDTVVSESEMTSVPPPMEITDAPIDPPVTVKLSLPAPLPR